MTADELSTPLGRNKPVRRKRKLPFSLLQVVAGLCALILLAFAGVALFVKDPLGGEPIARLALKPDMPTPVPKSAEAPAAPSAPSAETKASAPAQPTTPTAPAAAPGQRTVNIIDGSSGTKQSVIIPDSAPNDGAAADRGRGTAQLLEKSRHGMIPIAAGGLKPFAAYAEGNDALRALAGSMPTVAIVVGGLGVGAAKTTDAIMKLPGEIGLAFTPYGSDPANLVARARAQHHEVLLQVPMEPFDYPDNDPGPQTLLTTLDAEQNLDRLAWHMSRFPGYVGIMNFMGAKFVATDAVLQPIIKDAAKRGLGYLDDGRAPRSLVGPIAENAAMPFARAEIVIDAVPSPAEIDRALAKLEAQAKERGNAIGIASALPVTIERLAAWTKQLEGRGVLLVPPTIAMLKSKSGSQ